MRKYKNTAKINNQIWEPKYAGWGDVLKNEEVHWNTRRRLRKKEKDMDSKAENSSIASEILTANNRKGSTESEEEERLQSSNDNNYNVSANTVIGDKEGDEEEEEEGWNESKDDEDSKNGSSISPDTIRRERKFENPENFCQLLWNEDNPALDVCIVFTQF